MSLSIKPLMVAHYRFDNGDDESFCSLDIGDFRTSVKKVVKEADCGDGSYRRLDMAIYAIFEKTARQILFEYSGEADIDKKFRKLLEDIDLPNQSWGHQFGGG